MKTTRASTRVPTASGCRRRARVRSGGSRLGEGALGPGVGVAPLAALQPQGAVVHAELLRGLAVRHSFNHDSVQRQLEVLVVLRQGGPPALRLALPRHLARHLARHLSRFRGRWELHEIVAEFAAAVSFATEKRLPFAYLGVQFSVECDWLFRAHPKLPWVQEKAISLLPG